MTKEQFLEKYGLVSADRMLGGINTPKFCYVTLQSLKSIHSRALLTGKDSELFRDTLAQLEDWIRVIDTDNDLADMDPNFHAQTQNS